MIPLIFITALTSGHAKGMMLCEANVDLLHTLYEYDLPCESRLLNRCYLGDNTLANYSQEFADFVCQKGVKIIPTNETKPELNQKMEMATVITRARIMVNHLIPDKNS